MGLVLSTKNLILKELSLMAKHEGLRAAYEALRASSALKNSGKELNKLLDLGAKL